MSRVASLILSLALATPGIAAASDEVYTVIRDKGAAANTAFSAGDFQNAAKLYEAVAALLQTVEGREKELAIVRFNLGRCYDELGQSVQALEAYKRSLQGPLDAQLAAPIRERVTTLETEALGRIRVVCGVDGAQVEVVGMQGIRSCGAVFTGITPGPHVVLARDGSGREQRVPAEVTAGKTVEVAVLTDDGDGSTNVLAWSLTGGAVLVLGGGIALNVAARDALSDADRLDMLYQANADDDTRVARDEADDEARTYSTVSYVMLGVGAGLAVGAAWAWIAGADGDGPTALVPWVSADAVGLIGRF